MQNVVVVGVNALISIIMMLSGLLVMKKPPREINHFYGYRTSRSMKTPELWKEANAYSARLMMRLGIWMLVLGSLMGLVIPQPLIGLGAIVGFMIVMFILLFVRVEARLRQIDRS